MDWQGAENTGKHSAGWTAKRARLWRAAFRMKTDCASFIDSTQRVQTDVRVIGRSPESGAIGRMRDLTYPLIRDSLCPVLSV